MNRYPVSYLFRTGARIFVNDLMPENQSCSKGSVSKTSPRSPGRPLGRFSCQTPSGREWTGSLFPGQVDHLADMGRADRLALLFDRKLRESVFVGKSSPKPGGRP